MESDEKEFYPKMTLRDYFAAQAIQGCAELAGSVTECLTEKRVKLAYKIADLMLKYRGRHTEVGI